MSATGRGRLFNALGHYVDPTSGTRLPRRVMGRDLVGCPADAPTSLYATVYVLPATRPVAGASGIAAGVPSLDPGDYLSLQVRALPHAQWLLL